MTHPNLIQRLRAAFSPSLIHPAQLQSYRMPDLERWNMPHRSVDMKDWEVALNMAKNLYRPDRSKLMDLYESLLKDAHLGSVVETRVLRVIRSRFKLVDTQGKARPDLLHLLETQWFEDFLQFVAEAAFHGHTLIELGELTKPGELRQVNRIDPRNVLPYAGVVARRQGEETGYLFREEPLRTYLIEVGRPDDLGILERVAPVAVVKKYAIGSWSQFVGTYGIPSRWVKTRGNDARRVKQLEQVMQNMLSSAYAVIQGDEEFGISPTPGGDPHKVFDDLVSRMNSEISKRILGTDATTDNKDASGTYGSVKVQQGVAEDRHAADKSSVAYVVNQELLPRLAALGYPLAGIRFQWDELRDMAPMELVDAVSKLGMVFDIDPKHVEERTGIKINGPRRMPGELGDGGWPPAEPTGSGRQGGRKPAPSEEEDEGDEDEDGDDVTAQWGGSAHTCAICGGGGEITASAVPPLDEDAIDDALRAAFKGKRWSQPYFEAIHRVLRGALTANWNPSKTEVSYDSPDHIVMAMADANLFRFSGVKSLATILDLNTLAKKGGTYGDFLRRVNESGILDKYTKSSLRAEYTNVAMSSLQIGRYWDMQRTQTIMPYGEYVTIGDARVRAAHADLNGRKWPLGHDAWKTIWPPNGWNCRCTVLPSETGPDGPDADAQWKAAQRDLGTSGEWTKMAKSGFDGNRAITGSIFDLNKAYVNIVGKTNNATFKLNVSDSYGRTDMSWPDIKGRAWPSWTPQPKDQSAALRWLKEMGAGESPNAYATFKDHNGAPWTLDKRTVSEHTNTNIKQGKYASRGDYLHLIPEVMANPDEVWQGGFTQGRVRLFYIKYYDELPLVVRAEVDPNDMSKSYGMKITSWYDGTPKPPAKPNDPSWQNEITARGNLLTKQMPAP